VTRQIHVVGAVILKDGLVLCAQRGPQGSLPGLWEFPGGKIEQGESAAAALEREIREELECTVEVGREITTTTHEYDFGDVTLTTFYCSLLAGTPTLTEHVAIKWLRPDELDTISWAPADIPAVDMIRADHT
jgi:8-oxo-dGTP diphosphatase